mgnify:FL=1
MSKQQNESDYELHLLCRSMREELNTIRFTNDIIFGRSLLNKTDTIIDSKDNYILSFVVELNKKK